MSGLFERYSQALAVESGGHFHALWKAAKPVRKRLGGALGGARSRLLIPHKHPQKHSGAFFNSKITRYPCLAIISYRWHAFSYCSLFNSGRTEIELYLPDGTLPLSFTGGYRVSGLETPTLTYSKQICQSII